MSREGADRSSTTGEPAHAPHRASLAHPLVLSNAVGLYLPNNGLESLRQPRRDH